MNPDLLKPALIALERSMKKAAASNGFLEYRSAGVMAKAIVTGCALRVACSIFQPPPASPERLAMAGKRNSKHVTRNGFLSIIPLLHYSTTPCARQKLSLCI
jgi:hypothetical protein